jgi:hypothetical protein
MSTGNKTKQRKRKFIKQHPEAKKLNAKSFNAAYQLWRQKQKINGT